VNSHGAETVYKRADCILHDGPVNPSGYGLTKYEGRTRKAHVAAVLAGGRKIPKGWHVHHACGVKLCVNPEHLRILSPVEHSRTHAPEALPTLRHVRLAASMTLKELARLSGIHKAIISQIERGRMNATRTEIEAFDEALGCRFESRALLVNTEER